MNKSLKRIILGFLLAVLCGAAYYFLFFIKTPLYSINLIREAVAKSDVVTFEKHVDLDSIYNKGYTDMFIAMERITGEEIVSNPFGAGLLQIIKPVVVETLKAKTLEKINEQNQATNPEAPKNKIAEKATKSLESKMDTADMQLTDISTISQDGNTAHIMLTFHDTKLNQNFPLKLKMEKLSDGSWCVKAITNIVEFMTELDKAEKIYSQRQQQTI